MVGAAFAWSVYYNGIDDYKLYYKLDIIDTTFTLYLFPLSYFYIKSLATEKWFGWQEVLWLIPGALIGIISIILYLAMGEDNAAGYLKEVIENYGELKTYTAPIYAVHYFFNMLGFYVVVAIQALVLVIFGTIQLFHSKGYLRAFFVHSATEIMKKNRIVLVGMWALLLMALVAFMTEYFLPVNSHDVAPYFIGFNGLIFFFLGYSVYSQTILSLEENMSVEAELDTNDKNDTKEELITSVVTGNNSILSRFNQLMDERIYLRKNLRVDDVASMIHTNRTYISRLLKEEFESNFSDFINRKRIEYARELMRKQPQLTQEQIAEKSGFVHTSSFSRIFKQYTGMTFREAHKR